MDAIPDLSDNQVIVFTDWTGRSPQEVEDQVTYPLMGRVVFEYRLGFARVLNIPCGRQSNGSTR